LRRDLHLEGDDRRLLEVVYNEAQRLAAIVTDFLKYARPRPVNKSPQALTEILDDLLLLLSQDQKSRDRIRIERRYEDGLPAVDADAAQTRDALWNLLVNAVEAMPEGGPLSVDVLRVDESKAPYVKIVISDKGKGIPADALERIFQPFHTTKAEGTGLGLAIVKRIVDDHGGYIEVESTPGQGSSFILYLPLTPNH
jgi:signal transduction histidine kinase